MHPFYKREYTKRAKHYTLGVLAGLTLVVDGLNRIENNNFVESQQALSMERKDMPHPNAGIELLLGLFVAGTSGLFLLSQGATLGNYLLYEHIERRREEYRNT